MESNANAPVTRADLEQFGRAIVREIGELINARARQSEEQFAERLQHVEEQFAERLQHVEEQFAEQIHDAETRLLKAFYQYQEHTDVRMRKMSADISNMDTAG